MKKKKDAKGYLEAIRKLHHAGVNSASFYPVIEQDNQSEDDDIRYGE